MKKFLRLNSIIACILALVLIFAGCDNSASKGDDSSALTSVETTVQTTETSEETSAETSAETSEQTTDTESSTTDTEAPEQPDDEPETPTNAFYNPENLSTSKIDLLAVPARTDKPYAEINGNLPFFTEQEITNVAFESYSPLDAFGRCGAALACCGKEIMPAPGEERGNISSVKPSGWVQAQYTCVSGQSLYNRCHLIAWQLSAENANRENLVTGTRYLNTDGMIPFENMIADYITETGNHVMYRVTPIFEGNNLLASGIQLEAYSVEDRGESICFNVYCYNVQPFIVIDYATGNSYFDEKDFEANKPDFDDVGFYILNKNRMKIHYPNCSSVTQMSPTNRVEYTGTVNDLKSQGYSTCGNCFAGQ